MSSRPWPKPKHFVETSAFYAATDSGDRSHSKAKNLLGDAAGLVTTDHVLVES